MYSRQMHHGHSCATEHAQCQEDDKYGLIIRSFPARVKTYLSRANNEEGRMCLGKDPRFAGAWMLCQALQGHTPPFVLHVLPPRNPFHYISSHVEETEAVMQRERLKLVSSFHPLPLQVCLATEPSAALQCGVCREGGAMQAVAVSKDPQRDIVSLCGTPYHDHAHNLQKSHLQMKH